MIEHATSPNCPYCVLQAHDHPEPAGGRITREHSSRAEAESAAAAIRDAFTLR
jgi:hypothetical protein